MPNKGVNERFYSGFGSFIPEIRPNIAQLGIKENDLKKERQSSLEDLFKAILTKIRDLTRANEEIESLLASKTFLESTREC